jgi:hypothetical protein
MKFFETATAFLFAHQPNNLNFASKRPTAEYVTTDDKTLNEDQP